MTATSPPKWFWIVSILALIWNLLGVLAYIGQVMAPEQLEPAVREMIENRPTWATAAFATAVWGSALGCILLLARKSLAIYIFILSFIGIVVQMIYNYAVAESTYDYGPGDHVMAVMILAIGIALIMLARKAKSQSWLT